MTNVKKNNWIGGNVKSNITVKQWKELFKDKEIFDKHSLELLYRMVDYGGMASCKQLSVKYGESYNFYNNVFLEIKQVTKYLDWSLTAKRNIGLFFLLVKMLTKKMALLFGS